MIELQAETVAPMHGVVVGRSLRRKQLIHTGSGTQVISASLTALEGELDYRSVDPYGQLRIW
jgi:hypothetical protein